MGRKKKKDSPLSVLEDLCTTVEVTGGVVPNPECDGTFVLVADRDWVDLADVYIRACAVLGRQPLMKGNDDD